MGAFHQKKNDEKLRWRIASKKKNQFRGTPMCLGINKKTFRFRVLTIYLLHSYICYVSVFPTIATFIDDSKFAFSEYFIEHVYPCSLSLEISLYDPAVHRHPRVYQL